MGNVSSEEAMDDATRENIATTNGNLFLNKYFLPEELLILLLSHVPPKELPRLALVCKEWNRIIKSTNLWIEIYKKFYGNKHPKRLPWYLFYVKLSTNFFDTNLIRNTNGELGLKHWQQSNEYSGEGFIVEREPQGSQPLPPSEDFNGHKCCFATSYLKCSKQQIIKFHKKIYKDILHKHKPVILASEWFAPRFDCGCKYCLMVTLVDHNKRTKTISENKRCEQWTEAEWQKVEIIHTHYEDINYIVFQHDGKDTQFWKGHYGSKMAGASLKILFDSIDS